MNVSGVESNTKDVLLVPSASGAGVFCEDADVVTMDILT